MKTIKLLKSKAALLALALVVSMGFGGAAYASSHNFGYTLPGWQGNVTLQAGTRAESSTSADVTVTDGSARKFWIWCDAPSVNTRITDSVLVTQDGLYSLSYYSRKSGNVYLRGCTDGWQEPNYVAGRVVF